MHRLVRYLNLGLELLGIDTGAEVHSQESRARMEAWLGEQPFGARGPLSQGRPASRAADLAELAAFEQVRARTEAAQGAYRQQQKQLQRAQRGRLGGLSNSLAVEEQEHVDGEGQHEDEGGRRGRGAAAASYAAGIARGVATAAVVKTGEVAAAAGAATGLVAAAAAGTAVGLATAAATTAVVAAEAAGPRAAARLGVAVPQPAHGGGTGAASTSAPQQAPSTEQISDPAAPEVAGEGHSNAHGLAALSGTSLAKRNLAELQGQGICVPGGNGDQLQQAGDRGIAGEAGGGTPGAGRPGGPRRRMLARRGKREAGPGSSSRVPRAQGVGGAQGWRRAGDGLQAPLATPVVVVAERDGPPGAVQVEAQVAGRGCRPTAGAALG